MKRFVVVLLSILSLPAWSAEAPAVIVHEVSDSTLRPVFSMVGRIEAVERVDLVARVSGTLEQQLFREGAQVEPEQALFTIEKRPYEIQVKQAQATLDGARAALKNNEAELKRLQQLRKKGVASRSDLDKAEAARDQSKSQVVQAEAGLETAKLNLSYTDIRSPIGGRIGKVQITPGNLVGNNSGTLATVVRTDPVYVEMAVSDKVLIDARRAGVFKQEPDISPTLVLSDGSQYEQTGKFNFASPEVNRNTDTVLIRASFPNPTGLLLPGEFVRVQVADRHQQAVVAVPQSAVQKNRQGYFVLTVDRNDQVVQREIQVGRQEAGQWEVTAGLNKGERVIIEGLQKVRPGITVRAVER